MINRNAIIESVTGSLIDEETETVYEFKADPPEQLAELLTRDPPLYVECSDEDAVFTLHMRNGKTVELTSVAQMIPKLAKHLRARTAEMLEESAKEEAKAKQRLKYAEFMAEIRGKVDAH